MLVAIGRVSTKNTFVITDCHTLLSTSHASVFEWNKQYRTK